MRKFVAIVCVGAALGVPSPAGSASGEADAETSQESGFNLSCSYLATHILVVDANGRVQEVWKGQAFLGDQIPIQHFFGPALPMLAAGRWDGGDVLPSDRRQSQFSLPGHTDRLILFLVKGEVGEGSMKSLEGWLPASRSGWFGSSTARVRVFGGVQYVSVIPRSWLEGLSGISDSGDCGDLAPFKESVRRAMRPGFYD